MLDAGHGAASVVTTRRRADTPDRPRRRVGRLSPPGGQALATRPGRGDRARGRPAGGGTWTAGSRSGTARTCWPACGPGSRPEPCLRPGPASTGHHSRRPHRARGRCTGAPQRRHPGFVRLTPPTRPTPGRTPTPSCPGRGPWAQLRRRVALRAVCRSASRHVAYERYQELFHRDEARDPAHARRAWAEERQDLHVLAGRGFLRRAGRR
jgi:hypothetical protein